MELLILVLLAALNGVFAMSEIAVVSARRARLQQRAEDGSAGARAALELASNPNRFLSTVQVGISLIGVLAGAFGGATLARPLADNLREIDGLAPYADALGFALIVILTTYLSLVIGELVPKRVAMRFPEQIAGLVARPMHVLARITRPLVVVLSVSTDTVLWIIGVRGTQQETITEEEISLMLREGAAQGYFHKSEPEMVAGVFRLDELRIEALMTPRTEMIWLDIDTTPEKVRAFLVEHDHSLYPVCRGDLDDVVGMVSARDLLRRCMTGQDFALPDLVQPVRFLPHTTPAAEALEFLRAQRSKALMVMGEFGGVDGLITVSDIVEAVVGDIDTPEAVRRDDNSWLIDGLMPVEEFRHAVAMRPELPGEDENLYQTVGGFIVAHLGRIPHAADHFTLDGYRYEVVDMDGRRVDKVLVQRLDPPDETGSTKTAKSL